MAPRRSTTTGRAATVGPGCSPRTSRRRQRKASGCRRNPPRWRIQHADCLRALPKLQANSIDAIITDPPYGLEFMGKEWDRLGDIGKASHQGFDDQPGFKGFRVASYNASANVKCRRCRRWKWADEDRKCRCVPFGDFPNVKADQGRRMQEWHERWAREALRVLKPGGHLLAFGGTRTFHRLTCALEDAGFEIRDCLCWLYGQGFPKSLNVAAAIDKAEGRDRDTKEKLTASPVEPYQARSRAAEAWQGWGTALKPAWEAIIVARKPLEGTVAQNVLRHGTGALNINGCRIGFRCQTDERSSKTKNRHADFRSKKRRNRIYGRDERSRGNYDAPGRWPANVALSHTDRCRQDCPVRMLDQQSGDIGKGRGRDSGERHTEERREDCHSGGFGASRFFYCAKASRSERNAGLGSSYLRGKTQRKNVHPTVKPIALMRYLVRLVTPPGGIILDPFAGSGSTGIAAVIEGARFLGIERETDYVPIARARIRHWAGRTGEADR
jgi:DNA modification methylase